MRFYRGVYSLWASNPEIWMYQYCYVYDHELQRWKKVREAAGTPFNLYSLNFYDLDTNEQRIVLEWTEYLNYQLS